MAVVAQTLSGSVGRRGQDKKVDVELVQRLLNQNIQPQLKALVVDGIAGNNTIRAIEWFQKQVVGMAVPDGRVDPNGKTLAAMSKPKPQGVGTLVESPTVPAAGSDPIRINNEAAEQLINPASHLTIGGIWGEVHSGETWLSTDGNRLVLSAGHRGVIYMLDSGQLYLQSARGFVGDVTTYPFIEGARRAAPMVRLVEYEVYFIMGVVSATSLAGFAVITGAATLSFVVSNRNNFGKWSKTMGAILSVRSSMKQIAPTLYDKVFEATLFVFIKDVMPNSPGAISSENLAKAVGAIVGRLGKKMAEGKFSALTVLVTLLLQVATKCLTALPNAMNITVGEYKESAETLIQSLRANGVTISSEDARKIFEEIRQHPKEIKEMFDRILQSSR